MKLIAGLGNPGNQYQLTRHNVGFLAIDRLIDNWKAEGLTKKHNGLTWTTTLSGERVLLVKPQTYMNRSGECIAPLFYFYKLRANDLIVLHDEVDLYALSMKIKQGGGTAGHNGLKSIDQNIGRENKDYIRVRIGVGRSEGVDTASHVLSPFTDSELNSLDTVLEDITKACELIVNGNLIKAMNCFNQRKKKVGDE